jgi:hypothetical protein
MSDIPPIHLVWEEPAWPDAIRAPLADDAVRQRLTAAAEIFGVEIASATPGQPELDALVGGERLLTDWVKRGFPRRPPRGSVALLKSLLERYGMSDAADEIGARYPPDLDPGGAGIPLPGPRVIIRTPPPPSEVNLATWFAPPVKQLDLARQRRSSYDAWYLKEIGQPPVLSSRNAQLTGLTRFMNGRLPAAPTDLEPELWEKAANDWLFKRPETPDAPPAPAACLFGLDDPTVAGDQFQLLDAVLIPDSRIQGADSRTTDGLNQPLATTVHVRFQQKYAAWPVLGGRVIVHMAAGDPHCSVSSAYLPIPADRFAHYQLRSEAEAVVIALRALTQHALNGKLEEAEALGLYGAVLDRWLVAGPSDLTGEEWPKIVPAIANVLTKHVRSARQTHLADGALDRLTAALAGDAPASIQDARHALHEIQAKLAAERVVRWDGGRVVTYLPNLPGAANRNDKCFVLPFVGEYYLAYRVEFRSKARDRGWRVFVNADAGDTSCDVLGWPESLMAHALDIFPTSEAARTGATQSVNTAGVDLAFMDLRWHEDAVAGAPTLSPAQIEQNTHGVSADLIQDAANVAYHASEFYKYFASLCRNQSIETMFETPRPGPRYFEVQVGAGANAGDPLGTGFLAAADAPAIVFQSAGALRVGLRGVRWPARDPEVVFHELAHALMWLVNSEPFDMAGSVVPFARSLIEGYANYYARACAVSVAGDAAGVAWARACYDDHAAGFGDRFDLSRDSQRDPVGNRLPFSNLFPPGGPDPDANDPLTAGALQKYSVGMVWARALWEMREGFRAAGLDPLLADRLALNSYFYMPGWLASFETAAEGILDQLDPVRAARLSERFGARNILAGRGVQALVVAGADALAGADAGVTRRPAAAAAATAWGAWEAFPAGEGVTGLAHDPASGQTFAATERGVYAWDAAAAAWTPLGTWKTKLTQETPLCLAAVGGTVYAGTARGLYVLAANAPGGDWARWEGDQGLAYLVRQVAVAREAGGGGVDEDIAYVATLREARKRRLAVNELDPGGVQWGDAASLNPNPNLNLQAQMGATTAAVIEAAVGANWVYIGTLQQGIWRQRTRSNTANWTRITKPGDVEGAVLALHVRQVNGATEVLAGTTAGLFRGREGSNPPDPWAWRKVPFDNDPQAHETITAVLYLSDTVWLVGTANQALWRVEDVPGGQPTWTQYRAIGL